MLDDLKLIHQRDSRDALGVAAKQWQQYLNGFKFKLDTDRSITSIVVSGMGGSGLSARVMENSPELRVPLHLVQDYKLPSYVEQDTLVIFSSYSGNTEETLTTLKETLSLPDTKKPVMVVITSGGQLRNLAEDNKLPLVVIPEGYQPRMAFGYQLRALLEVISNQLNEGVIPQIEVTANWLRQEIEQWTEVVPTSGNQAKTLALDLLGKSIVVYASKQLSAAAYKWKISFNESSKNIAWYNQFPEYNHNEFIGWTGQPVDKPYAIVELRSKLDHERIQKRFTISDKMLSGQRPSPEIVEIKGDNYLAQVMWSVALGDFVSLYLAVLNNIDPTPVDLIERFKVNMTE